MNIGVSEFNCLAVSDICTVAISESRGFNVSRTEVDDWNFTGKGVYSSRYRLDARITVHDAEVTLRFRIWSFAYYGRILVDTNTVVLDPRNIAQEISLSSGEAPITHNYIVDVTQTAGEGTASVAMVMLIMCGSSSRLLRGEGVT